MIKEDDNFQKDMALKEPKILDQYSLDINYITQAQVAHQARELYSRKIMYQNQIMNLKEKGKRLLKLDELDYVERQQEIDAQILAEKLLKKQKKNSSHRLKTEKYLYDQIQVM